MWRRTLELSLCLSLLTGCAPIVSWRADLAHHYQARKAWDEYKTRGARLEFGSDFVRGWKSGYFDAACGGNGAPPAVPPERYWKPYFQTPQGHVQVDAWYEGYQSGTIAADQDGVQLLAQIPTAPGLGAPPQKFWGPLPPTVVPVEEALPAPDSNAAPEEEVARLPVGSTPAAPGSQLPPRLANQPKPSAPSVPFATSQPVPPVANQPTVAVVPPRNAQPDSPPPSAVVESVPAVADAAPSTPEQVAEAKPQTDVGPVKKKLAFKWPLLIRPVPVVAAAPPKKESTATPVPVISPVAETAPSAPGSEHIAEAEPVADSMQPTETPVASSPVVTAPVSMTPAAPVAVGTPQQGPPMEPEPAVSTIAEAAPRASEPEPVATPEPRTEVVRSNKKSVMRSPVVTEAVEPIAAASPMTPPLAVAQPTTSVTDEAVPSAPEPAKVATTESKPEVVRQTKKLDAELHVVTKTAEADHAPATTPSALTAAVANRVARQPHPPRVRLVVPQEDGRPQSSLVIVAAAVEVDLASEVGETTASGLVKPQQVRLTARVVEPAAGLAESWRPATSTAAATPEPESGAERTSAVVSVRPIQSTDVAGPGPDATERKPRWPLVEQDVQFSSSSEPARIADSDATAGSERSLAAAPSISSSAISESTLRFLRAWTFGRTAVETKPDASSGEVAGLAVEATEPRPAAPLDPPLRGTESMAARTTVRFR
jgi:hypothetical protein